MKRFPLFIILVAQASLLAVNIARADPWYVRTSTNFPPTWINGPTNDSQQAYAELCLVNPTNKTVGGTLSITINSNATSMTFSAGIVAVNVGPVSSNVWSAINSLPSTNQIDVVVGSQTNLPPVHLRGTIISSNALGQVTLFWSYFSNGNAPTGFVIRRDTNSSPVTIVGSTSDGVRTNWLDTTATRGLTNFYQCAAYNAAGTSSWSSVAAHFQN